MIWRPHDSLNYDGLSDYYRNLLLAENMPIFRTLLIILVIYLVFKVGQILYRSHRRRNTVAAQQRSQQITTTVVPCAICGVHVPKAEALAINGRYACSQSHGQDLSNRG